MNLRDSTELFYLFRSLIIIMNFNILIDEQTQKCVATYVVMKHDKSTKEMATLLK